MKKLSLPALAFAVLGISSQASALDRCMTDAVVTISQGLGRQRWAKRCALENPYALSTVRDMRFWHSSFATQVSNYADLGIQVYPVYWDPTTNQPWLGPGAAGTSTSVFPGAQIASLPCTIKPEHVFMDGLCML